MLPLLLSCAAPPSVSLEEGPEAIPGIEDPSAALFDKSRVHTVEITLSDSALRALREHPWDYVPGAAVVDGIAVEEVGVRLKGAGGSFLPINRKANFKIDFNQYVEGQTLFGVEQLTLDNMIVDCSYLREEIAFMVFAPLGIPQTRTAYTWVTVNGEDYGLYFMPETPDDVWLSRSYDDPDGNLYDGKYVFTEDWSWYSLVDFTRRYQDYFELEEGEDVGRADIHAVTDAVLSAPVEGGGELAGLVDWEQLQRVWIGEEWVGQLDGYFLNQNNYRVYFNPESERMEMLPWDLDYAFYPASSWGMSWDRPRGVLAEYCLSSDTCREGLRQTALEAAERLDTAALLAHIDEMSALLRPYTQADAMACTNKRRIPYYQDELRDWVQRRSAQVATHWESVR